MRLDLNHLAVLEALVNERSIPGAARRLHMTPQAVGAALRRLREFTGDPLLVREGRAMRPTDLALQVVKPVGAALDRLRDVIWRGRNDTAGGDAQGTVHLALIDYASELLLPRIAQLLHEAEPHLELRATRVEATPLAVRLAAAENHFVITRSMPMPSSLRKRLLLREGWKVVLREDHPAPHALTIDDYCGLPHAVQMHGHALPNTAIDIELARHGRKRDVALVCSTSFPSVAPRRDFVATAPDSVSLKRALARNLRVVDPPIDIPPAELSLVWHRKREGEALHRTLRAIVERAVELM